MKSLQSIIQNSERDFRKQFDELGLKPPRNSMKNMERELIIDYWRKGLTFAYEAGRNDGQAIKDASIIRLVDEKFMDGFEKAVKEIQKDVKSVLHMLNGDTDRVKIANYIRKYLLSSISSKE